MTALLELANVSYRYRGRNAPLAVDDISLAVTEHAHLGIVGESGAGKTTLLRLLLGLAAPTSGRVLVDGEPFDLRERSALRRFRTRVQPVFQDPYSSLDPRQRIDRIVGEPLRSLGLATGTAARDRVAAALEAVGLSPASGGRYPHEFSGGQRQRIAIARALVAEPRVLIADEPVSALDLTTRVAILDLLETLAAERGMTTVLVSHDLGVVARLCSEIAVVRGGQLEEAGATRDVLRAPASAYTRALLDAVPRLHPGA